MALVWWGVVSPMNLGLSRPRIMLGVTVQDPPQVDIATLPAVGGDTIAVSPLPIPPRMQNVALTGASTIVPNALPAAAPISTAVDSDSAQPGALEPTSVSTRKSATIRRMRHLHPGVGSFTIPGSGRGHVARVLPRAAGSILSR